MLNTPWRTRALADAALENHRLDLMSKFLLVHRRQLGECIEELVLKNFLDVARILSRLPFESILSFQRAHLASGAVLHLRPVAVVPILHVIRCRKAASFRYAQWNAHLCRAYSSPLLLSLCYLHMH